MKLQIAFSLCVFLCQGLFFVKIQAKETCLYSVGNGDTNTTECEDQCCSKVATSIRTACCSSVSLSSLAIPFFIIAAICILGICILYCRPVWRGCLFGNRCPCENRTRITSARSVPPQTNPVFVLHNDDLPDYETITKDTSVKDFTPPPYNFVATHPTDFGIDTRVPSAPPQYSSRRPSVSSSNRDVPTN